MRFLNSMLFQGETHKYQLEKCTFAIVRKDRNLYIYEEHKYKLRKKNSGNLSNFVDNQFKLDR